MSDLNNRPTVVTKDSRGRADSRRYAFSPLEITATAVGSAQEVAAAGEGEVCLLSINVSDSTNQDEKISFCLVENGGNASDSNTAIENWQVGSYGAATVELMLNPGQSLYAYASTPNALRVSGWITAYL